MKIFLGMFLAIHPAMAVGVHTVPADIRDHFIRSGCSEITDYYSESRVVEKPYLYGVRSTITGNKIDNDYSFVAWCKSNDRSERKYILVGRLGGAVWPGGCKLPIRDFDYPGGLSIKRRRIDLSGYMDFARKEVGKSSAVGPVIRSEKDGLVYEVFCHHGSWVKRNID